MAGWCLPVAPDNLVLIDHAVAINDGKIVDLLPASEARQRYQPGVLVQRPDHILLPGFVNAHTHAAMSLLRGIADDMPLETWLSEAIWPVENRWVSACLALTDETAQIDRGVLYQRKTGADDLV